MAAALRVQVSVTVASSAGASYTVPATVTAGRWKALLRPTPASDSSFNITVACEAGCGPGPTTVTLTDVVFGDVYFCFGQSNMWLPMMHT